MDYVSSYTIARAGGGDSYSSPSSSSSSSSSDHSSSSGSGSSSGGATYTGSPIGIVGFIVFIIIAVIVGNALKKAGKLGNLKNHINMNDLSKNPLGELIEATVETAMEGQATAQPVVDIQAKLDQIKTTDPGFNEQIFKDKAQNAFFKIQEAWEKQDMNIARPFVSESIMNRYTTQINDIKSRGEKNVLENIVIGNMDIVDVNSDNAFNYIKTKIDASCADYTLDRQGKMIRGSKTSTGFSEFWTFIRTVGVVTNNDKQLKDNKCPNCGAPLEVNATGQCNYCSAVVSSGQYDWVLSQIDQV